jgi:hypothetical protein
MIMYLNILYSHCLIYEWGNIKGKMPPSQDYIDISLWHIGHLINKSNLLPSENF